jgi:ribosomal-protein-alanine N-acetyltransferase
MKIPFLIGDKLYLRPLEKTDINGNYVSWLNDAEICQFNSHHFFQYSKEKAEDYIAKVNRSSSEIVLAIVCKENDLHIGNISLQNINLLSRNAELAILLGDKNYWGKGYSKEASKILVNHGFTELNLHRIYCGTSADNLAMQNIAGYLGMQQEGRRLEALYKSGKYVDIVEYGVLQRDFANKYWK